MKIALITEKSTNKEISQSLLKNYAGTIILDLEKDPRFASLSVMAACVGWATLAVARTTQCVTRHFGARAAPRWAGTHGHRVCTPAIRTGMAA